MRQTLAFALLLFAFGYIVAHLQGCRPEVREAVENAAAVAQYKGLLAECRERGRKAGSYEAYERCASDVDRALCRESSLRCDGGVP